MGIDDSMGQPPLPLPLPLPLRILTVYAHPDDESFGPAAALAKYARLGAVIYGVFFTRGEHGESGIEPTPSPQELARLRDLDVREASALIGYRAIESLGYEDGGLENVPREELQARVLEAMRRWEPDIVITFGPAGISRHADHIALSRAATAAFHQARGLGLPVRALFYDAVTPERARERGLADQPDGQPNTLIDVAETQPVKLAALRLHARSIKDATAMIERLEREQRTVATFHRAWPPVPPGVVLDGFLTEI